MSFWRRLYPFNRRRKKRGYPTLESKTPQRRTGDKPQAKRYPRYRSALRRRLRPAYGRIAFYGIGVAALYLAWIYFTLPNINDLNKFTKTPSIIVKSEDGQIIGSFGDIYGEYIPFSQLPPALINAVIATEDRNFYHHFGIDPLGMLRAFFADVRAGRVVQGGSTITQQVAKNIFLTPERSLSRKIREMILAVELEKHYSKQELLSIYLNRVYLGAGNYGVDAAARRYFGVSARDLTLPESAIIAGLLKAPSRFAPTGNPKLAIRRGDQVLVNMQEAGYLNQGQELKARGELAQTINALPRHTESSLYFADWIADQLPDYIGNVQDDLVVVTTLNPAWQALGEKAINDIMDKEGAARNASQAALLAMSPDGAVRVMIGGRSYAKSQYNRATQALRQPGSAFKLFVYLTALEAGMTPDTEVVDQPVSIRVVGGYWEPKDYEDKYLGVIPLREAVAQSINTVAAQVAERVGLNNVVAMARRLGITSDLEPLPSIALGSTEVSLIELTAAYAHLPANGQAVYPYGIISIATAGGDLVYVREASGVGMALSPRIVGEMNDMLLGVVQHGTGRAAQIGRPAAGKTGTTSDYRDAWFIGFTPQLATGVWVGNDDNTAMKKVTGGTLPARIWHEFMMAAMENQPVEDIPIDGGGFIPLPWQQQQAPPPAASLPQPVSSQNLPPPGQQHPQPAQKGGGIILGPEFWQKLFGR